ncbi:hypothetical protein PIB30_035661 [Stylosanthes scabra]|uniref:Transmembrane protein n=1 Tax=Stylosanthes scabra TaxID=79078 RepID=A0ABU6SES4_9FABA|nr:hypothetical protein [Stylosanthes scabra]
MMMMKKTTVIMKTHAFLLALFLLAFVVMEARPLSKIGSESSVISREGLAVDYFFDWLSLGAIKSGPSPAGKGHKFDETLLGGIKDSGPSGSGVGHSSTNTNTLGGIKDSGPSAGGKGHKFTTAQTLGGIKDSGPSPGQGH